MSFYDPMSADFPFTIGIEEEYQVVDPETRELRSYITQILERGQMILREQIKPEMHQSIVEVGTRPCRTVAEARAEVTRLRGTIAALADKHGLKILAAGTHPISSWMNQEITPFERYKGVVDEMQDLALQLLIFGMHVHVGMPNNDVAIDLMNVARYILPHMLALSTSSPFWMGRNTGFKSYRSAVFSNFPRTGIPPSFVSRAEFDGYINLLISTGSIDNGKKIWWDMRPHPQFGTLEFRVCDICRRGLAAADVADAELQRAELRVRAHVPPDLLAVVDRAGADQQIDIAIELGARHERRRDAGAREVRKDRAAVGFEAGVAAHPERRRGRERQHMRQDVARDVHQIDRDIIVGHADMHMHAEDQQLERQILHFVDHAFVALERRDLLVHPR